MGMDGSRTPDEQVKDFVGQTKEITLSNGLTVSITTPRLRWWFGFLLPKFKESQWSNINPQIRSKMTKELQKGKLSPDTIAGLPLPILDVLLEMIVHYVGKDKEWCLDNLDITDLLLILNTFLEVADAKKVMDFFVQIAKQVPIFLLAGVAKGV